MSKLLVCLDKCYKFALEIMMFYIIKMNLNLNMQYSEQRSHPIAAYKRIKKRVIRHGNIKKASINKNCPKFIVGHCWLTFKDKILSQCSSDQINYVMQSFELVERWIHSGERDKLNLNHLIILFGKASQMSQSLRKFYSSKAFYKFLSDTSLQIIMQNKRVEKVLSYLICLEKFTSRLGHPQLIYKLQFK